MREAPGLVFADEETEVAPQQQLALSSISRTLQCVPQMLRKASRRPFQKVLQPPVEYDEIWANRSVRKREHRLLWRLDYFLRGKNDHTDFSHTQNCEKIRTSSQLSLPLSSDLADDSALRSGKGQGSRVAFGDPA